MKGRFFSMLIAALASFSVVLASFSISSSQAILTQGANVTLSSVQGDQYSVLSHPRFPGHSVRVKKSEFCDPTVNVYTGYLDVSEGAKHLFFYFFESRRDPERDDVMMWINGGPGCSSSMGLLMELGPCSINMNANATDPNSDATAWNPYSWNEEANIFFLDQPVGVGFSYADYGETIETTEEAAKNVQAFITIFFETFKQFEGRALHLSGESYGGRYLPVFASEIYDQNQIAKKEGRATINLQSVLIGNGNTGIPYLYPGRYEVECGTAALDIPFQAIGRCVRMKQALPRCQEAIRGGCLDQFDLINCRAAINFCDSELSAPLHDSGRNPYDVSKMCVGNDLCYAENSAIKAFLDLPSTRALLGVESPSNFSACSNKVGELFDKHMDKYAVPTQYYVAGLLDRGVRVLIYAGTYDWQCNWVSNKMWTDALEWSGSEKYRKEEMKDWYVSGKKAGEVKGSFEDGMAFVTIRDAGHMVPYDKPKESLTMVRKWLKKQEL